MAKIFPTPAIGTAPPEAMKVAQRLRRLPDATFTVWQRLSIWAEPGPDFWVLGPQQRAAFITVSTATPQDARRARQAGAQLTDFLLSYDQEWVLKNDLGLTDDAQAVPGALGLQLVHGVAGSGKSLIVVYRARLLRQFFPQKRILILTHNKPLILDL